MNVHPRARRATTGEYHCPDCGCIWSLGEAPVKCTPLAGHRSSLQTGRKAIEDLRKILRH